MNAHEVRPKYVPTGLVQNNLIFFFGEKKKPHIKIIRNVQCFFKLMLTRYLKKGKENQIKMPIGFKSNK